MNIAVSTAPTVLMSNHHLIDERSVAFGSAIAARLPGHPELLARARATVARWMADGSSRARPDLQEWLAALDGPLDGVITLLTGPDERAVRLRQSNPFAGVLPPDERTAILKQFQTHDASRFWVPSPTRPPSEHPI